MSDEPDAEDTVEIPLLREQVLAQVQREAFAADPAPDPEYSLSEPERVWLLWFYSLTPDDQRIVERCGENGVSVDADNFEQMKKVLLFNEVKGRKS